MCIWNWAAPVIVFDDADLDAVVETIRVVVSNAGQDCAQPCRILVQDAVYDRVVRRANSALKFRSAHRARKARKWVQLSRQHSAIVSPDLWIARGSAEVVCGAMR